jgi:hypothetical protein
MIPDVIAPIISLLLTVVPPLLVNRVNTIDRDDRDSSTQLSDLTGTER